MLIYLHVYLLAYPPIHLSTNPLTYRPIYLISPNLSGHLSINQPTCMPLYVTTYPSNYDKL